MPAALSKCAKFRVRRCQATINLSSVVGRTLRFLGPQRSVPYDWKGNAPKEKPRLEYAVGRVLRVGATAGAVPLG